MVPVPSSFYLRFTIHDLLIEKRLHAVKSTRCFAESRPLFQCFAVVARRVEVFLARLVSASKIEMRKCVRFGTRGIERALEPAYARVGVAFGEQVAADIVV